MTNEILLVASLLFSYGALIFLFRFFGNGGVFAWIALATILANIEVAVLVDAFGMEQTLGNTLFASTFLATDILSEFYGKKIARRGVLIGICASVAFIFFSTIWVRYVPSPNDGVMGAMRTLFSNTPRILAASFAGFAASEMFDIWAYEKWRAFTTRLCGDGRKFLWLRNNGSTLISQAINIALFNFLAFAGIFDKPTLISVTISCYVIYTFTSLLDTPFIYLARAVFEKFGAEEQFAK